MADQTDLEKGEGETLSKASSSSGQSPMIGGYRIIREIGSGGMGIVYEAEQQHPKRLVALKVIRGGRFVDEQRVKLFEREAQALARLKHPGIAAIYESGRTPDGQHFFVMELVRGETLKCYLEKANTSGPLTHAQFRERLAIFRKIADAVTYAHQRGVIHRDLKPANIIILSEFESSESRSGVQTPGVKILDFGLARITETDLAVSTIGTEFGGIQGTLPYMSPEQLRGNPDEIDVRSDVYSLGVVLYEIIAGRLPYNVHRAMLHEAARMICETPPAPLSKSWSGKKKLDRDIETIVEKALEKPAARRYQSVSALADDVSRFLTGQPILARPPSLAYTLKKLAARHKVGFGFAAALVLLIAVFAVVVSIQAGRIARERDRANREAQISKQVADFMRTLFQAPDPYEGKGKEVTAREILDEGSARIAAELKDQPEVQTELALLMGESYYNLRIADKAEQLGQMGLEVSRRRLGQESAAAAKALTLLGAVKMRQNDLVSAEKFTQEGLNLRLKLFGHDSIQAAENINNIGTININKGDWKKAQESLRESLAIYRAVLGDNNEEVAGRMNNLALALKLDGKPEEAAPFYQQSLSIRRRIRGPNHPTMSQSLNNLAMLYVEMKKYPEAEAALHEALSINRRAMGEVHPEVSMNLINLGRLNLQRGRLALAEDYFRQALDMDNKFYGENNPRLVDNLAQIGVVLTKEKKFSEAESSLRKAVSLESVQSTPGHWRTALKNNQLGACLADQKKFIEAEPLLIESYSIIKKQFGPQHSQTREAGLPLIALYESWGKHDKAGALKAELGMTK